MKTKKIVRMPLRRPPPRPRPPASLLRARAATADEAYTEEDYESEDEPNMKLSHALLVVLVLHVIAVGGIFAFNSMKAKQTAEARTAKAATTDAGTTTTPSDSNPSADASSTATAPASTVVTPPTEADAPKTHTVQSGDTLGHIASHYKVGMLALEKANGLTEVSMLHVGQVLKIPSSAGSPSAEISAPPAPVPVASQATDAAKTAAATHTTGTYVVAKGENPYTIAKKLHVSYSQLLAVNGIKDPKKIQIGQKLKIPPKKN